MEGTDERESFSNQETRVEFDSSLGEKIKRILSEPVLEMPTGFLPRQEWEKKGEEELKRGGVMVCFLDLAGGA